MIRLENAWSKMVSVCVMVNTHRTSARKTSLEKAYHWVAANGLGMVYPVPNDGY